MRTKHTRPIKIAYFIGTLKVGGTEKHLLNVVRHLDRSRFKTHVYCLSEGGPLEEAFREAGCGVTILGYKGLRPGRNELAVPKIVVAFREFGRTIALLKKSRPDIVHCYLFHANLIGALAARLAGCPVVITSRRSLGYFKDGKPYYQWLENLVNRFTDIVTVNSKAVMADVLRRERLDPKKIRLIYNGIDATLYQEDRRARAEIRKEFSLRADTPLITTVANLIPYKGHADLLRAAALLYQQVPAARFLLVGRDEGTETSLRKLAAELGLEERVIFAGPRADIPRILAATDIMVLPSHEEGFANVILEGMAAGLPLVVTNVGGNPEAVVDGETGLLVPPRNPEELAGAIRKLLAEPAYAQKLGEAARKRAAACFSLTRMIREYEEMYLSAFNQKRSGS